MKRVLALVTSTWWGGLALVSRESAAEPPRVIAEFGATIHGSHAGQLLPRAEVHRYADAAHWVVEDAHERIVPHMQAFLDRTGA